MGNPSLNSRHEKISFHVRKQCRVLTKILCRKITMLSGKTPSNGYSMEVFTTMLDFSIKSSTGAAIAEVSEMC